MVLDRERWKGKRLEYWWTITWYKLVWRKLVVIVASLPRTIPLLSSV